MAAAACLRLPGLRGRSHFEGHSGLLANQPSTLPVMLSRLSDGAVDRDMTYLDFSGKH